MKHRQDKQSLPSSLNPIRKNVYKLFTFINWELNKEGEFVLRLMISNRQPESKFVFGYQIWKNKTDVCTVVDGKDGRTSPSSSPGRKQSGGKMQKVWSINQ